MIILKKREVDKKDISYKISNLLLILGVIIVLVSELFLPINVSETTMGNQLLSQKDYRLEREQDGSRIFIFSGKQLHDFGDTLAFYTNHQKIEAIADNVNIFSVQCNKTSFGRTTGCRWNFISIPDECQTLSVHIAAVYETNENDELTFIAGNGNALLRNITRRTVFSGFLSIFNVIIGICMIALWGILNARISIEKSLLYLGQFAVVIGLWSFVETDFSVLIFQNRAAMTFMAYILLSLMPLPFVLFARNYMRVEKDRFWYILFYGIVLNFFACTGLQLLKIKDMKETVLFTHVILILSFLYMCHCNVINLRRGNLLQRIKVHVYAIIIIGLSVAADLGAYYIGSHQINSVGRIGFNLYILLLGIEAARETVERLEEGLKAEYYRKAAITDNLTGIYNRMAFDKAVNGNKKEPCAVILYDLNDLKYVNDTYGHASGDTYIIEAALIIQNAFSNADHLYRIGGDEFCCILEKMSKENFEKSEAKLRRLEEKYNTDSPQIKIHIACGFASNEIDGDDKDINELIKLADKRMYSNKRVMKENLQSRY